MDHGVSGGVATLMQGKELVTDDRTAAMLVRVWLEDDGQVFRARLLAVGGEGADDRGDGPERTIATVSSPGDLLAAVGDWLDDFTRSADEAD